MADVRPKRAYRKRGAAASVEKPQVVSAAPVLDDDDDQADSGNGIRALVTGLEVLQAIARHRRPLALRDVAASAGLSPSRVHRYLTSLVAAKFVEQNPASGYYGLGQSVIELGLLALGQLDTIRTGVEALQSFSEETGMDGHLAVWGSFGPTIVRWKSGRLGHQYKIEEGRVLPLLWSATGRVLMAYRDEADYRALLSREIEEWNRWHPEMRIGTREVTAMLAKVRKHGLSESRPSASQDQLMEPVFPRLFSMFQFSGVAVPVFDHQGRVVMALTFFTSDVDRLTDGVSFSDRLRQLALATSQRMGASTPDISPA